MKLIKRNPNQTNTNLWFRNQNEQKQINYYFSKPEFQQQTMKVSSHVSSSSNKPLNLQNTEDLRQSQMTNFNHTSSIQWVADSNLITSEQTYSSFFQESVSVFGNNIPCSPLLTKEEIKLLKKRRVGECSSKCTICYEKYSKRQIIRSLPCGHSFHYKCLKPWLKTSIHCPLCRYDLKAFCQNKLDLIQKSKKMNNQSTKPEISIESDNSKPISDSFSENKFGIDEYLNIESNSVKIEEEKQEVPLATQLEFLKNDDLWNDDRLNFQNNDNIFGEKLKLAENQSQFSFLGAERQSEHIKFGIEEEFSVINF